MSTEESASDLVVHASRLVRMVRRQLDMPAGIRVLSLLDELGPLGVTALAAADKSSQPSMSAAVATLVEHGWVDKRPSPVDARASLVELTTAGRDELARVRRTYAATVADLLAATDHSGADLATAVAVLRDVVAASHLDPTSEGEQ